MAHPIGLLFILLGLLVVIGAALAFDTWWQAQQKRHIDQEADALIEDIQRQADIEEGVVKAQPTPKSPEPTPKKTKSIWERLDDE